MSIIGNPITVGGGSADLGTKSITANGTYSASDDSLDGYSEVSVNVSGGGTSISTDYVKGGVFVPTMTSATTPSGTVTVSSQLNGGYAGYMAFDNVDTNHDGNYGWLANDSSPYIQYVSDTYMRFDKILIRTANNSVAATKTVTIEGLTQEGVWENCLASGNTVTLEFAAHTYGDSCTKYDIELNGKTYHGIKISGNEAFWGGSGNYACIFDTIQVYIPSSGTLPGVGYYTETIPDSNIGENGNICTVIGKGVYQKDNGTWILID